MNVASKVCKTCGRQITWRAKWAKNWDSITYCSDSCRRNKRLSPFDRALERSMLASLGFPSMTSAAPSSNDRSAHAVPSNRSEDNPAAKDAIVDDGKVPEVIVERRKGNVVRVSDIERAVVERFSSSPSLPLDDSAGPNETAGKSATSDALRETRERARRAARRLVDAGKVEIVQDSKVVDPSFAKGEIDVRRKDGSS